MPHKGRDIFRTPAQRAQMAEMMKGRGVQLPDENGNLRACLTKDTLDSGAAWQQMASESGCTTNYSTRSATNWKWHTSCTGAMKSESDGEMAFAGAEGSKDPGKISGVAIERQNAEREAWRRKNLPGPVWLRLMVPLLAIVGSVFIVTVYADDIRIARLRQHNLPVPDDPDLGHPAH